MGQEGNKVEKKADKGISKGFILLVLVLLAAVYLAKGYVATGRYRFVLHEKEADFYRFDTVTGKAFYLDTFYDNKMKPTMTLGWKRVAEENLEEFKKRRHFNQTVVPKILAKALSKKGITAEEINTMVKKAEKAEFSYSTSSK
ncbi:hypothetical protein OAO01_05030 [Oligoflexia bacterium]|nr:hypothetical protein [Oligoflexia bacterium]